jgi:hypothetical protein
MSIYYLYVKTHKITGLKYLGKTKQDPLKYQGSGKHWKKHLSKYGKDVHTIIIKECSSNEELSFWGRYYSKLWNIVDGQDDFGNKIWANVIPETGGGIGVVPTVTIIQKRIETRKNNINTGKTVGCSTESIQKANATKLKNGTMNSRTNDNIKKQLETRKNRGTGPDSPHVIEKSNSTKIKNGTVGFTKINPTKIKTMCPHCNKSIGKGLFTRWHGDNCKLKPT